MDQFMLTQYAERIRHGRVVRVKQPSPQNQRRIQAAIRYAESRGWIFNRMSLAGTAYMIKGWLRIRISDHSHTGVKSLKHGVYSVIVKRFQTWKDEMRAAVRMTEWTGNTQIRAERVPREKVASYYIRRYKRRIEREARFDMAVCTACGTG